MSAQHSPLDDIRKRMDSLRRELDALARLDRIGSGTPGAEINTALADTPLDADKMGFWDVVDSALKSITWANIKATLKTYFDTLYVALTGDQTVGGIKTFSGTLTKFDSGGGVTSLQWLQSAVSKAIIGVAHATNAIVTGTVSGDLAIRTANQKMIFSNNDGTTDHLTLSGASAPEFRLNSVTGNSAAMRYAIGGTNKALIGAAGATNNLITGTVAGDLAIRVASGQEILFSTNDGTTEHVTMTGTDIWIAGACSALSFVDRTKGYEGDALSELAGVRAKDGEIDHATLPEFARTERVGKDGEAEAGRDLGAMISMLTVAVQQLSERLDKLEGGK